ncbi:MAG: 3-oxoacyl-ACP reductase FabG [Gammaproteobacteria bacterium]|nr:3-oxoacyl-ACP reductase FabG [Gammaproteobacteria bacterium]NIM71803.1 3-oxoacyl-ACP reductase FabG [Gammaproteobacteria bacterium]NIN37925.1 3-oxoacyl-ACP reductase FabG [Gammaproteobacteria bacterium]NIO23559.1 3-oxoacyl-ACP reductase FabG [Gammaproteobacteria bacterium]NIO64175.1 3-oxoacyl-ACP reductase FabG [Gammaproteobacteria bacterium]
MTLEQDIALVTGASRGIGMAIARALGEQGAFVVGTATTDAGAERIGQAFGEADIQGFGATLDVSDSASVSALFERLESDSRNPTILVNNAGITRDNLLARMSEDEWEAVLNTDLTSLYRVCRASVRHLMKARRGRIINITSVVGATGNPGQSNYAAAKAGIIGFTRALARELAGRNITVNAVAPGFIATDMTAEIPDKQREQLLAGIPMKRLGMPEEVASAVLFLASPGAAYITGETLHVNGGMYMG